MVIDILKELGQNFIDFSYEANSARAFADARDGLKPGQRACLWEMFNSGYTSKKPHVKSAKIAGAVTGNWWPHGDVAIYDTFARMSQPWINNIPEVSWHGNNGSQFTGPECASSRYTEARLSSIIEDGMFKGIKKNNVNMISNYSEDAEWPEVLPAVFPRLMVNGCQGIGSTIANVWLPHSLKDVSLALNNYITTGVIDTSNLYPSFPSGGIIINKNDIHTIYETGKGKVVLRGKAEIKDNKILITELPYQVYVQPYVEKLLDMAIKDEIEGIESVSNKSGKGKLLIEVECLTSPQSVLNQLYAKTDLQKSYSANQWALVGKTPKLLTLKEYFDIYIAHNLNCIVRETQYDLTAAKDRLHIVLGLLKALDDIDNIITLIKKSANSTEAKEQLIKKYSFSEEQAKAILAMRLSSLAHLEKLELTKEQAELEHNITEYEEIINNIDKQKVILTERLSSITSKYGDDRKTELVNIEIKKEDKEIETVVPEDVVVIVSQTGLVKRIPAQNFKVQKRNGKGVKNEEEAILTAISTNTIDALMLFTNKGKMYRLLVDNIPNGTTASRGVRVHDLLKMDNDETVIAATSLYRNSKADNVVFFTKKGMIKKTKLEEFDSVKKTTGIVAIKLKENDSLANVTFLNEEDVILVTKNGMSIHFDTKSITPIGRASMGVKAITLAENDEVLAGLPIHKETDCLATFSNNGLGKKSLLSEFPIQGRGGKGVKCSVNPLIGATMISDEDNILLVGKPKSICISAKEVPLLTRTSLGNAMIKDSNLIKTVKL